MSLKRLEREIKLLEQSTTGKYTVTQDPNDLYVCNATISGPENTPYEGGVFFLDLTFPTEYPFKPPVVQFHTRVYHCNISREGKICLEVLQEWSPATSMGKILDEVWNCLNEANPDSPVQPEIADLYRRDRDEHDKKAREFTSLYAT